MPADDRVVFEPQSRSLRTLFLGLMSVGIVVILLGGVIGIAAFLYPDKIHSSSPRRGARETEMARAKPQPTNKILGPDPTKETPSKPALVPQKHPRPKKEEFEEAVPVEPVAPKRQPEASAPAKVEKEQPKAPRPDTVPAEMPPEKEPSKPVPPAKMELPKREEPVKVEAAKSEPSVKEEMPREKATPKAEEPGSEKAAARVPERKKLSGPEIYRQLVKSCVIVWNGDGWGSGCLIHKQSKLILTNYHVVGSSRDVDVAFPDYDHTEEPISDFTHYFKQNLDKQTLEPIRKRFIHGTVKRIHKEKDLALVKLDTVPEKTPAVKLSVKSARSLQAIHSVGNPGAAKALWVPSSGSVRVRKPAERWTAGGGGESHNYDADILLVQSATNPGDSGGPLVNEAVQLVGVVHGDYPTANSMCIFIDLSEVRKILQEEGVDLSEVTATSEFAEGGRVETSDIPELVKCLEKKDAKVRIEAAERLAELGPQAKTAAAALVKALKDKEPLVRQIAATALGKLGRDSGKEVRKDVFKALNDKDAGVRLAALEALANLGKPDLSELPILLEKLHSSVEEGQLKSCFLIAQLLASLGPDAKSAVPDLREMLKSENLSVRRAALWTLGKIGPEAREAAPEMSKALKDTDWNVSIFAALALTAIDPSLVGDGRKAVSVLVLALRTASKAEASNDQARALRKEIAAALAKIGEPVVEHLLSAIKNDFPRSRHRRGTDAADLDAMGRAAALKIIADIGSAAHSTETMRILADVQTSDPYPRVKEAAKEAYTAIQKSR
jgi:HEAT repeat protein